MARLEDIKSGAAVGGVMPSQSVEVVSVEWIGGQAINLVYRVPGGSVAEDVQASIAEPSALTGQLSQPSSQRLVLAHLRLASIHTRIDPGQGASPPLGIALLFHRQSTACRLEPGFRSVRRLSRTHGVRLLPFLASPSAWLHRAFARLAFYALTHSGWKRSTGWLHASLISRATVAANS